jgi:hypothetical protein
MNTFFFMAILLFSLLDCIQFFPPNPAQPLQHLAGQGPFYRNGIRLRLSPPRFEHGRIIPTKTGVCRIASSFGGAGAAVTLCYEMPED